MCGDGSIENNTETGSKVSGDTEPEVVDTIVGRVPAAVCGAEDPRFAVPGATTRDTLAGIWPCVCRAVGWYIIVIVFIAVLYSFPDVTVHVVYAKEIGAVVANRCGLIVVSVIT